MKNQLKYLALISFTLLLTVGISSQRLLADPPAPPKTSTYAPVKILLEQVDYFKGRVEPAFEDKEDYDEIMVSKVQREMNTLTVLLMALGLHDQDNRLKASAPALVDLSRKVFDSAKDYDKAKASFDEFSKALAEGAKGGTPLKWEKRYKLGLLMKQVTSSDSRLRRGLTESRFRRSRERENAAEYATLLAVIAQASLVDTHEVKDEQQKPLWYKLNAEWRTAASDIRKAAEANDFNAAHQASLRMKKSCDDCHDAFRVEH